MTLGSSCQGLSPSSTARRWGSFFRTSFGKKPTVSPCPAWLNCRLRRSPSVSLPGGTKQRFHSPPCLPKELLIPLSRRVITQYPSGIGARAPAFRGRAQVARSKSGACPLAIQHISSVPLQRRPKRRQQDSGHRRGFFGAFSFFGYTARHLDLKFPDQGSNLCPLSWKHEV